MKKFNPEKELNKIRKGNKNKILYSIITLLLIVAIGSTYALYQVRHTNKIVYTTVDKFINKDIILSVKLDDKDESVNEFPTADSGYVYSHTECEKGNITGITWDEGQRSLNMNSKGPDKCTVYFVKSPFHMKSCEDKSMADCLLEEGQKFTDYLAFDDPDQNGRYIGADPANYIWFNCDDYSNPNEDTCERWRIIGSFNNIEKVNDGDTTTPQNLVKIIRSEKIGNFVWDNKKLPDEYINSDSGYVDTNGYNKWEDATLMKILNPDYDNNKNPETDILANNSLYWNREVGQCAAAGANQLKDCDFKESGLKNNKTKEFIEKVVWYLGGTSNSNITTQTSYEEERSNEVYTGNATSWLGKIGLLYPSDMGYATDGGEISRNTCLKFTLNMWEDNIACYQNSWLVDSTRGYQWSLTHRRESITSVTDLYYHGRIASGCSGRYEMAVRPSLYLTYDTKVVGGDGTYDNPYSIN